ncbi:hypothetical protein B0H16DRAFT_1462905 [Mycena metata]|uniref:Uncharacterized protein n=1 Tax=Mycena metata TaxID=1033252 RepID=A0AAD7IK77_9AGAR|nr:hypothetical protein B0H16DRAFT_1462905 [Mycena metata]
MPDKCQWIPAPAGIRPPRASFLPITEGKGEAQPPDAGEVRYGGGKPAFSFMSLPSGWPLKIQPLRQGKSIDEIRTLHGPKGRAGFCEKQNFDRACVAKTSR